MELFALIVYGIVNVAMVVSHLLKRDRIYEFPFWAGAISLGWFYPQAIGGYINISMFPDGAYTNGMFFATLSLVALWVGFSYRLQVRQLKPSWLDAAFEIEKLYRAGMILCVFGFFFQYKLSSLPDEILSETQWSGVAVKYFFLASVFEFGLITLWLLYLSQRKWMQPRLLVLIVPGLLLLLQAVIIHGRRAVMMKLVAYVFVSLWFVRRFLIPRAILILSLVFGLILINSIGIYRSIMSETDLPLLERLSEASKADYTKPAEKTFRESGAEFTNYIFTRQVAAEEAVYDFGLEHWNRMVFNFVPAQLVGRSVKDSLMLPIEFNAMKLAERRYGHHYLTGTTSTGFKDAFISFGWMGFIKFLLIGYIMGVLYRYAMTGVFLGQLLYVYMLSPAMHSLTHNTHSVLVSSWIYFFVLGYPVLYYAKVNREKGTSPPL